MRTRLTKLAAGLAALAALALGGSAIASATGKTTRQPPGPPAAALVRAGATVADGDNVQQGDQTSPDTADTKAEAAAEQAGAEQPDAAQASESTTESATEQPGADAPDGPADEAGSADADADTGR